MLHLSFFQLLHKSKLGKKVSQWPRLVRYQYFLRFVLLKLIQIIIFLIDCFSFVISNDPVKVEGYTQFQI